MNENLIIKDLNENLKNSYKYESSHWKYYLKDAEYLNVNNTTGFGEFTKKSFMHSIFHKVLQFVTYGIRISYSKEFNLFKEICKQQQRQLDVDVLRHVFTFKLLNQYKLLKENICLIGDGRSNFASGLIKMNEPNLKIYSVNLPKVLINDYLMLKNYDLINDKDIIVVKNEADINRKDKKLFLIDVSNYKLLEYVKINLFVNIVSMQEMNIEMIEKYFDIIKKNKSYFYCCNREYKKLYGGEEIIFSNYPWKFNKCKKIFYENCLWHQKFYELKRPFIRKYDGNVKHALVKY